MRLCTPEISWHETLPIYSCDFQNRVQNGVQCVPKDARTPLGELKPPEVQSESDADLNWTRLATAGGDNVVRLWRIQLSWIQSAGVMSSTESGDVAKKHGNITEQLNYLASLKRHEKPVNVVRWSPSGDYLASAGDDLFIILWSKQSVEFNVQLIVDTTANGNLKEDDDEENGSNLEVWIPCRNLRRHLEDIYDLCWSPDERALISGSVDHSIIVWQLDLTPAVNTALEDTVTSDTKSDLQTPSAVNPTKTLILRDHKHYVQGVAWDPLGFYVASLSSDRACRIYRAGTRNCLAHVSKAGKQRLFQDDSWKSFFRRLTFSPDGLFLVCPSGNLEEAAFAGQSSSYTSSSTIQQLDSLPNDASPSVGPQHAAHVFLRSNFVRPIVSLPTGTQPVVAVRFCPTPFQLRSNNSVDLSNRPSTLFDLPYRWLFCLVLEDCILFYDTQQSQPFAQVSQLHYQAINDATWSKDGHLVVVCSTDGYCSIIRFAHGELGHLYRGQTGVCGPNSASANQSESEPLHERKKVDQGNSVGVPSSDKDGSVLSTAVIKPVATDLPNKDREIESLSKIQNSSSTPSVQSKRRVSLTTLSTPKNDGPLPKTNDVPLFIDLTVLQDANESNPSQCKRTLNDSNASELAPSDNETGAAVAGPSSDAGRKKRRVSFITLNDQVGKTD